MTTVLRVSDCAMSTATPTYDELAATWMRLHHFGHLQSIAGWDQAANMPPKGNEARAAALAEMAREQPRTLPALGAISGVGAKKLQAYGPELLRLLANGEQLADDPPARA